MMKIWQSIVKAPYRGLPWLILAYIVICHLSLRQSGVFTGRLIGFDDQVRMLQVLNWINGAGWYDRTIMRANPPEGFTSIWSRIVDIPIAVVILIAQQFVTQKTAALVAAVVVPLAQIALLFVAAPYFARPLVGKQKARLIILFLIFTSLLSAKTFSASGFLFGQASHHPWYVILYMTMFGATARLAMGSARQAPVFMLGGSIALLTAIGIEGYPMIGGITAILALVAWAFDRPVVAARGGTAVLCGALGALLLLPMHQPPSHFLVISFAEPSILGVILVTVAGLFLNIENLVLRRFSGRQQMSAMLMGIVAAFFAIALVGLFPAILDGGAAGLSPRERAMALHDHFEARSVYDVSRSLVEYIYLMMPAAIALVAGVYALLYARGRRRAMHFCYLGFALLGSGMCSLYSRYYHHAMTTACVWLLWVWEECKKRLRKNRNYSLYALGIFVALGPLWMLLLPAAVNNLPFTAYVVMFPAALEASPEMCDSLPLAEYINRHYSKNTLAIVPWWESAQLLYQTDIRIDFLANYPSHDKFIDTYAFYSGTDMEASREIAARHGADIVTVCQYPYLYRPGYPDGVQTMVARMQAGRVPPWLKLVNTGIETNYVLYEIDKSLVGKPQ